MRFELNLSNACFVIWQLTFNVTFRFYFTLFELWLKFEQILINWIANELFLLLKQKHCQVCWLQSELIEYET